VTITLQIVLFGARRRDGRDLPAHTATGCAHRN
jgi:hypothetical protein